MPWENYLYQPLSGARIRQIWQNQKFLGCLTSRRASDTFKGKFDPKRDAYNKPPFKSREAGSSCPFSPLAYQLDCG